MMSTRRTRESVRRRTRRNVWPFTSSRRRAEESHERLSSRLVDAAYSAGKRSGKTAGFKSWFNSLGLESPSQSVKTGLADAYGHGVRDAQKGIAGQSVVPITSKKTEKEDMAHLDAIARGLARGKRFKSLKPEEQELVRRLAQQNPSLLSKNRRGGPPLRSTAKSALRLYERGTGTVYKWTAGLPARLAHSILDNPRAHGHGVLNVGVDLSKTPPDENGTIHGPWQRVASQTPVQILDVHKTHKRRFGPRTETRVLVQADYYGTPYWGWTDESYIDKANPGCGCSHCSNPKRTSGRYLPPGTRVIINDSWSINAAATIVKWGYSVHPLYKSPETALVRMERSGKEREVPLHAISLPEGEKGWPKGSSYRPNPASIFDYEDAQRAGRSRALRLGAGVSDHAIQEQFDIWWKYEGSGIAQPNDRAGNWKVYRRAFKQTAKGRRNPQAGADRMYEIFHGKKPDTEIIVKEEIHEHDHLATLGQLVEIVVETLTGKELTLGWDDDETHPWLACNEKGTQLYIEGGDQSIPLDRVGMGGQDWVKDSMVIGDLIKTTYRTEKDFDNFEEIDYYHANGEESGVPPELIYDPISKKMYVSGGKYRIEHDGLID